MSAPSVSPSQVPSSSPSATLSFLPTQVPSSSPTAAPTNKLCDITVQTNNTFLLCSFFVEFESLFNGTINNANSRVSNSNQRTTDYLIDILHSENYCNENFFNNFLECDSIYNEFITHIYFGSGGINGEIKQFMIDIIGELGKQGYLKVLDLSNNGIHGSISDWSPFGYVKLFLCF